MLTPCDFLEIYRSDFCEKIHGLPLLILVITNYKAYYPLWIWFSLVVLVKQL